jgi:hypothetical protein
MKEAFCTPLMKSPPSRGAYVLKKAIRQDFIAASR